MTDTKTKTKTQTIREQITKAEADHLAAIEAKHAEFAEARDLLAQRTDEQEAAVAALAAITEALAAGSTPVTPAELSDARSALDFANIARDAAQRRVDTLAHVRTVASHEVADALLPAIETMLPGVEIIATLVNPPTIAEADVPVAFLVQQEAPTDSRSGSKGSGWISAEVRLHYFSGVIHRPLEREVLERTLDDAQIRLEGFTQVSVRDLGDGVLEHTARLRPGAVAPPLAVLQFHPHAVHYLAGSVAAALAKTSTNYRKGSTGTAKELSNTVSPDGVRTVVLEIRATAEALGEFAVKGLATHGTPESVTSDLVGSFHNHLGRVTAAELVTQRHTEQQAESTVQIELTSKVA